MANNKDNKQTEERIMTKYDRKMQKRNEELLRAKRRKMAVRGTCIAVLAVCVVIAAVVIISNVGKSISYIKVDDKSISKSEFDFYYTRTVNSYSSMYSSYGLDTTQDLSAQQYSENLTWKDYFEQLATDELVRVKALVKDAEANGFKGDVDKEYEKYCNNYKKAAQANDMSEKDYYQNMFGASKADVEDYLKEYILANLWYNKVSDDKEPSADEIESYYEENKDDYDYVNYYVAQVTGEAVDTDSTDGTDDALMSELNAQAQAKLPTIETDGEYMEYAKKSGMNSVLSDWLFAEGRIDGESTVLEDTDNSVCYAVKFVERCKSEEPTADIRAIITDSADVSADDILDEWKKGDKTEDSFIELVNKYSTDTSVEDGLYEGVSKIGVNGDEIGDWIFDASRKEGDTTAITQDNGMKYVMYYKGQNKPDYQAGIITDLTSENMQTYVKELTDAVKVADPNGVLKYLEQAGE